MSFSLRKINVLGDISTMHQGKLANCRRMIRQLNRVNAIPKIQLFSEKTFPRDWMVPIFVESGIRFIPSVFQPEDVEFVLPFKPLALKIASVESTYPELLTTVLETNLPVIISTGGMSEDEFLDLISKVRDRADVCLMHCVSVYPTWVDDVNLLRLETMEEILGESEAGCQLGLSLHCPFYTTELCAAALVLGATQFEIHVREDKANFNKPDSAAAIHISQVRNLINTLNGIKGALGDGNLQGADYEAVRKWRKRWQEKSAS